MQNKVKMLLGAVGFALVLLLAVFGYNRLSPRFKAQTQSRAPSSPQSAESAAPDFTVQDANGAAVSLSKWKGKPVVLNFWASWCPPCKAEMPDYEKMYRQYSSEGVVFMMVNMTDGDRETVAAAKQFIRKNRYTFPVYFDTKLSAAETYHISAIPDSVFIDRSGHVAGFYEGEIDAAAIRQNIGKILQ